MTLTPLNLYLILIFGVSIAGRLAHRGAMGSGWRPRLDWTVLLPLLPMLATMIGAPWEHSALRTQPGPAHLIIGSLLFVVGTAIRVKGQFDIGANFSTAVEVTEGQSLVTTGLYAHIRHPLYLGNILMMLCPPAFFACHLSWIIAALGVAGFVARLKLEERHLSEHLEGYAEYVSKTWALVPHIF